MLQLVRRKQRTLLNCSLAPSSSLVLRLSPQLGMIKARVHFDSADPEIREQGLYLPPGAGSAACEIEQMFYCRCWEDQSQRAAAGILLGRSHIKFLQHVGR